jgi:RNA polymerase sigma factor (sigma-70 family)
MPISNEILEGCLENNRQSQKILYEQYFGFLMGVCYRYMQDMNEARFLVNEGFFKILTRLDKYDRHIPFEVWMRRVMVNTVIDHFRKNSKRKQLTVLQEDPGQNGQDKGDLSYAETEIETEHLKLMLQRVPEISRKVFNLFAIDGYSHKEIAGLMHITEGTSKWHVSSARQVLREQLKQYLNKTELQSYAK